MLWTFFDFTFHLWYVQTNMVLYVSLFFVCCLSHRAVFLQWLYQCGPLHNTLIEGLLKSSSEPSLAGFKGKYQVQLQKVIDIRWVSLAEQSPYYRRWPVKYHTAHEHAQQNDAIWEDVPRHLRMTPSWLSASVSCCGSDNAAISLLRLWSRVVRQGNPLCRIEPKMMFRQYNLLM